MEWIRIIALALFRRSGEPAITTLGVADFEPSRVRDQRSPRSGCCTGRSEHVAHPFNAPGPFYSEYEGCITCGAPHAEAPDLMAWYEDSTGTNRYTHCVFRRQPETAEEVERAIKAMDASCVENLRYRGKDPTILKRLCDMGYRHLCDALESE